MAAWRSQFFDNAHDLPWKALSFCLERADLSFADMDHIAFSFNPWARRAAIWHYHDVTPAMGDFGTLEGEEAFSQSDLRARDLLLSRMPRARFHFLSHHRSHAASAYFGFSVFQSRGPGGGRHC